MDFLLIGFVAFTASCLTFFSGFGLGTLLLPAFAMFLTAPAAVAATAVVHLLNGLFKGGLVYRTAHWPTVWRFGLPAIPGAMLGAFVLTLLGERPVRWAAFGYEFTPSTAGVLIGAVLIVFALLEMTPWFQKLQAPPHLVSLGGTTTGFFGGLTGQQGALRSMFLLRTGLDAKQFIATGVLVSILIDITRVPTYFAMFASSTLELGERQMWLIAVGSIAAFAGAWLGSQYLKKATIEVVRLIVATMMLLIGGALIFGLIGS